LSLKFKNKLSYLASSGLPYNDLRKPAASQEVKKINDIFRLAILVKTKRGLIAVRS